MFEVGVRFPTELVCRSEEECKEKLKEEPVYPGVVYEVMYEVDPPIKEDELYKLMDVIADFKKEYPRVNINYVYVSDDGKRVTIQFYDPELVPWGKIIVLILALAVIIAGWFAVTTIIREIRMTFLPPTPPPPWMWYVLAALGVGVAGALIGYGAYRIARAVRG